MSLADDNPWAFKLPLFSNMIALVLWLGFLSLSTVGFLWLLVTGFIIMLIIDYALSQAQVISADYFKVRKYVTLLVVISLIVSVMQL